MESREGSFSRKYSEVVASAHPGSSPSSSRSPVSNVYVAPHLREKEKKMPKTPNTKAAENLPAEGNRRCSGGNYVPVSSITHPNNRSKPYINTDKKPSEEKQMPFLYAENATQIRAHQNYSTEESGKWMMFFEKGRELDDHWDMAKRLYSEGKLDGITSMKVSTAFDNPRASNNRKMVTIGHNLLSHIPYNNHMAYKSDLQTLQGTRATGMKKNHLYSIKPSLTAAAGGPNVGESSSTAKE
ncbi:hypothetical protein niasHT_032428 [Heterodera trifolii]|uniref:Uncharacterized protein n=1 Tax=Heterodera trifolii TaxID=157864 RepID=A0ABD2IBW4_9BILA